MFLHLIGVLLFVAGVVLAGVAFESARRRPLAAEVALLLGLSRFAVGLVAGGGTLLGVFGLWLVHLGGWGYGSGWVDAAIVLYVIVLALGGAGGRPLRRARLLATSLAAQDGAPVSVELRELLEDRAARAANYASLVIVLAIIVLMVFKP